MDQALFRLVNNLAERSALLDAVGVFFAKPFIYIMGAAAAILMLYWWTQKKWQLPLMVGIVAIIMNEIIVQLAKLAFAHDRPFLVLENVHLLVTQPVTHAFPSGHTAAAFAIAVSVWLCNKRWGMGFLIGAVSIGLSRMFVGVHWPLDVGVGAMVGSGVALVSYLLVVSNLGSKKQKIVVK